MRIRYSIGLLMILIPFFTLAQAPQRWTSADIHEGIQKLNFLGSALYVAAHPDDENTSMIAYLSNKVKAKTAYLSLTRGDGGQNLIGPEIRELLGMIRTQELLAARRIDGGSQFFSRANDFGYSKTPDETFQIWDKEDVLADVIWVIRRWQPDIIINRFDHTGEHKTHGHHTASAMLSVEAFDLVGKESVHPEQLNDLPVWQPKRLFMNITPWFFRGKPKKWEQMDKSKFVKVDIGEYYPSNGYSNGEISALSRSQHKSQGFGRVGTRGKNLEYLKLLKGDLPEDRSDPFDGINTSWTRVEGGGPIGEQLETIEKDFDFSAPHNSVPQLVQVLSMIESLPDGYWKRVKAEEARELIAACLGLFLEARAKQATSCPGQSVALTFEAVNRSSIALAFKGVRVIPGLWDTTMTIELTGNEKWEKEIEVHLPTDIPYSNAYWLNKSWELGMYDVEDQNLRGLPETPRQFLVAFDFELEGQPVSWVKEVVFRSSDPVKGEVYQPFEVLPEVSLSLDQKVQIFTKPEPQQVEIVVRAHASETKGKVKVQLPEGWTITPKEASFSIALKDGEQRVQFLLTPPKEPSEGWVRPYAEVDNERFGQEMVAIDYDHIPRQLVFRASEGKVVNVDLKRSGEQIGYIMGAGDEVPASLAQMGYQVTVLEDEAIKADQLAQFDAVITGVRAYNTRERIRFLQAELMEYVKKGGTLLVQYNTSFRLKIPPEALAPDSLELSRDRVTVEDAEIRFLKPDHEVLNFPNRITEKDFEGWVQERGLYFPDQWGPSFEAILSCNDPGEEPKDGSLLVARHGQGHYIYTGLSFFRELPAGVPGAYRLFANLISIGKHSKP